MGGAMIERIKDWVYGIKTDKLLHFIAGLLVVQVSFILLSIRLEKLGSALLALAFTAIVGGIKEIVDSLTGGVPSWTDFLATIIGGVVGLLIMLCV